MKANIPSQRAGNPYGNNAHAPPNKAAITSTIGGAACCQVAIGKCAKNCITHISNSVSQFANGKSILKTGIVAATANGVMTIPTSGIAIALASGETKENC